MARKRFQERSIYVNTYYRILYQVVWMDSTAQKYNIRTFFSGYNKHWKIHFVSCYELNDVIGAQFISDRMNTSNISIFFSTGPTYFEHVHVIETYTFHLIDNTTWPKCVNQLFLGNFFPDTCGVRLLFIWFIWLLRWNHLWNLWVEWNVNNYNINNNTTRVRQIFDVFCAMSTYKHHHIGCQIVV